jgi:hypothetical protein
MAMHESCCKIQNACYNRRLFWSGSSVG